MFRFMLNTRQTHCIAAALIAINTVAFAQVADTRGPNHRFYEVARFLDSGGETYAYINVADKLRGFVEGSLPMVGAMAGVDPRALPPEGVGMVLEGLGLYGVEDLGYSVIRTQDGFRTSVFLRAPPPKRGLFVALGGPPHACASMGYAPADADLFIEFDLDVRASLDLARGFVMAVGGQRALGDFQEKLGELGMAIGAPVDRLAPTIAREFAIVVTLPKETPPSPDSPAAGVNPPIFGALLVEVKGPQMFDALSMRLKATGAPVKEDTEGGVRRIAVTTPAPDGMPLQPAIADDGRFVVIASHPLYLDALLATNAGVAGLRSTNEFKDRMDGLPQLSNGVLFMTDHCAEKASEAARDRSASMDTSLRVALQALSFGETPRGIASVRRNEPMGLWVVTNGPNRLAEIANTAAFALAGLASDNLAPGVLATRQAAEARACQANLAKLDGAKEQWALDNGKKMGDSVSMDDLVGPTLYLKRTPVCPTGGTYILGPIGANPACTMVARQPDHRLK